MSTDMVPSRINKKNRVSSFDLKIRAIRRRYSPDSPHELHAIPLEEFRPLAKSGEKRWPVPEYVGFAAGTETNEQKWVKKTPQSSSGASLTAATKSGHFE